MLYKKKSIARMLTYISRSHMAGSTTSINEKLPTEVNLLFCAQQSRPKDLRSLIRASPIHYSIFRDNKRKIYASIGQQAFHSEVSLLACRICDAAEVLKLPAPHRPWRRRSSGAGLPVAEIGFVEYKIRYINKFLFPKYCVDNSSSVSYQYFTLSFSLFNLWTVVDFFVEDYSRNTLSDWQYYVKRRNVQFYGKYSGKCTDEYCISSDEYERMQRAFCNFELYR